MMGTARSILTSPRPARTFFLTSSRTARRAEPGSSTTPMRAAPMQLAAIQPPTADSLDSCFRGNDIGVGCSPLSSTSPRTAHVSSLTSSRTARSAEPGSRQAPCKDLWIPAPAFAGGRLCAGMTAKEVGSLFLPSSRTPRTSFLSSSRPARTFFLTSPRTPRPFFFSSSRTARSDEPGSSATHSVTPILPATLPAPNALTRIQRVATGRATSVGISV